MHPTLIHSFIHQIKVTPSTITLDPFQTETFTWRYSPENLEHISNYEVDTLASTGNLNRSTSAIIRPSQPLTELAHQPKPLGGTGMDFNMTGGSHLSGGGGMGGMITDAETLFAKVAGTKSSFNKSFNKSFGNSNGGDGVGVGNNAGVILERTVKKETATHTVFAYLAAVEQKWPRAVAGIEEQVGLHE